MPFLFDTGLFSVKMKKFEPYFKISLGGHMKNILFEDVQHTHETVIDEDNAVFYFSLHPALNQWVLDLLSRRTHYNEVHEGYGLSKMIPPHETGWGYGKVLALSDYQGEHDWITWQCKLPEKPDWQRLDEIAATLHDLSVAISLFDKHVETAKHQFFEIDCIIVKSHDYLNSGSFSFMYSREVLGFAAAIWDKRNGYYQSLISCMQKVYARLAGKQLERILRDDFYIGMHQENPHWPFFRVPGNCACIAPEHFTHLSDKGARYHPHNLDSKIQQLSLLAGVVKLANLARQHQGAEK